MLTTESSKHQLLAVSRARQLIVLAAVFINIVAGVWIGVGVLSARSDQEAEAEASSRNIVAALDGRLSDLVAQIDLALLACVDQLEERQARGLPMSGDEATRVLERQRSRISGVYGLRLANADGEVVAGEGLPANRRASWARHAFFQQHREQPGLGLVVSDPLQGEVTHARLISLSRRVNRPDGSFAGVISASIDIGYIEGLLRSLNVGPAGTIVLRDSHNGLVTRQPPVAGPRGQPGDRTMAAELQDQLARGARSGTFHTLSAPDRQERISSFRRLAAVPYTVVAGHGADDYLAAWRRSVVAAAIECILILGFTVGVGVLVVRSIDRATHLTQAKARFLANMSHELRTPLNAIIGLNTLLRGSGLTTRQRDNLDKSDTAARSLLRLLNAVLDYSKMDAGKLEIEQRAFSTESLLRQLAVVISANTNPRAQVQVLFDIAPDLPPQLVGDELRLQQVLTNLASNALKFTDRGQVVVRIERSTTALGPVVLFSVQDSGIGIDPRQQKLIFSAFSQAEASTTRKYGGTGLGLAISRRLVQLMGGELSLQSSPGQGSVFSFTLPLKAAPVALPPPEAPEPPAAREKLRALLVDENPVARDITARQLGRLGFELCEAPALDRAHELSAQGQGLWDLLCVSLPDSDVKPVQRLVASTSPQPAVLLLARGERHAAALQAAIAGAGADTRVLAKPYTDAQLEDALNTLERPGAQPASFPDTDVQQRLQGLRILVVEDNLMNQHVAEELLASEGAQVALAANGRIGLEAVRTASPPFDLVLMDIQMPEMDGHQATRAIRQLPDQAGLPIIAMTANTDPADRAATRASGMDAHIGKPFDLDELVALIVSTRATTAARRSAAQAMAPVAPMLDLDLRRFETPIEPPPVELAAAADIHAADAIDLQRALVNVGGMKQLYVKAARLFTDNLERQFDALQASVAQNASVDAIRAMHTLKGNAATLGALGLAEVAAEVEAQWRTEGLADANAAIARVRARAGGARRAVLQAISELA